MVLALIERLITSKTRRKILTLFITNPKKKFYHAQIVKQFKLPSSAVQNELINLSEAGLVTSEKEANIKYYKLNESFPIYKELKSIIYKTTGLADIIKQNLSKIGNTKIAFIYGSVAKNIEDLHSDIDLMIIGDPDMDNLTKVISKAEDSISREINFTVFTSEEWKKNLKQKKAFVTNVYKDRKIFLIGSRNELQKISK